MTTTIEAHDLTKCYGEASAVDGVSFTVSEGEIFACLGRNGSGKTTTVGMLTTLIPLSRGSARVAGFDVVADAQQVRARIGVTMQDAALDPQMSGREHLEFIARILGHDRAAARERADAMAELFGLTEAAAQASATYSGGMRRRLDIATALLGSPEVLFLDEPTTGLDPQSRRALWGEIAELKARGVTIFLTTQYIEEAERLADHVAILDQGEVIARGTTAELKEQHARRHLSFRAPRDPGEIISVLAERPDIDARTEVGRINLEAPAVMTDRELLDLVSTIATTQHRLEGLQISATSLEDVFLRLTGTAITERARPTDTTP